MAYELNHFIKKFKDIGCDVFSDGSKVFTVDGEWDVNVQAMWCTNKSTGDKIRISDLLDLKKPKSVVKRIK